MDYIVKENRLLSDTTTYKKLCKNPLPEFKTEAHSLINDCVHQNIIDKVEASFLKKDFYCTAYFYHIPKVHKNPTCPQGWPIIASMDSITSGFLMYIDQYLQPLA